MHLPNETDRKFGVYIEVRGRISVEQLAAGVADGQPKIVVTKIAPCAVPFNDMGIRGGPTTAPTKPESQHR